ncbi:MAG: RND family transporter [Lachnospiraceae bacterium]
MIKFGKKVVKFRVPILILSFLLLIPAALGYFHTRVNYDILSYLPGDLETMKGQDIMLDEFGAGAFSICVVDGMNEKEVQNLTDQIKEVEHVKTVLSYDSVTQGRIPIEVMPKDVQEILQNKEKNESLLMVMFETSMSADETLDAVAEIRGLTDKQCLLSGMSATVTDMKNISLKEVPVYVLIAGILCIIVLAITMDSFLVPVFMLLSIGMAIVYNLGTNFVSGEISFITQALAAVLQLGVTMDYSIFLWHSYEDNKERFPGDKKRAMSHAVSNTLGSVVGSSITTVAGFLAMCFMTFTLGLDLGVVMAKGVVIGVIGCVTILPSMILIFDKPIEKTRHKALVPNMDKFAGFITKHYPVIAVLTIIVAVPIIYGYTHTSVYYDLAGTLPKDLESCMANDRLEEDFDMGATHMILCDPNMSAKDASNMINEINNVKGVKQTLALDAICGQNFPKKMLPKEVLEVMESDHYQMMLVSSKYKTATDEVNEQCTELKKIVKKYDSKGMFIGEAPCTKDLITITDKDFKTVSAVSIGLIFLIIAFVFRSLILPIILVCVIEFAIFINMGIPYYTGTILPFIASIVIGTIQLGATVDYAILMTTKYKKARFDGADKREAITTALASSAQSIVVSALSFFAATIGVGVYSSIDMISSLCTLISRGAIISMVVVLTVLPSMFMIFDKVICKTSKGFIDKNSKVITEQKNQ